MILDFIIRKNTYTKNFYAEYDNNTISHYHFFSSFVYRNCGVATTYRKANDPQYPEKLWNVSCRLLHLEPEEDFATFLKTISRQIL